MTSLRIGKIIFKMWKNKWFTVLKDSPIFGLLPIVLLVAIFASVGYIYISMEDIISSVGENLTTDNIFAFIYHYSTLSFFIVIGITFVLWQFMIRTSIQNKYLETLPVSLKDWKMGQLIPIIVLVHILVVSVFLPIMFVLLESLPLSLWHIVFLILLFLLVIHCAMLCGSLWQQGIYLLSKWLVTHSDAQLKAYHTLLSIISILVLALMTILLGIDTIQSFITVSPIGLFYDIVISIEHDTHFLLHFVGMIIYVFTFLMLLYFSFKIEGYWKGGIDQRFIPLKNLPFSFINWMTILILEIKRILRDIENLLYCFIALVLMVLVGYYIKLYATELNLVMLYEHFALWGVVEFLSIFPLLSRGRDVGKIAVYRTIPLSVTSYILGKYLIYVTVFPFVSCALYVLIMSVGGYDINPLSLDTYMYAYLFSVIIFSIAFSLGVILPSDDRKFINVFVNVIIFLIVSIPIYLIIIHVMQYSMIWLVVGAMVILVLILWICILIEKGRG
ncbi:hypothetical protein J416_14056 [Gracilibacillus halophilus YIM-C55.5]|uniref:Uncharacterized protein n=1 Tax=Gracilibacillus halophilus YIM-C55.5 TaxID=1308866 RepID=N4WI40_9BACI|nr:hypothetical protein [Gracilibacillus halophilus]ENH95842.1 hypothetical protein J416_14056 [Gracilibacillus halophilus YIM-C55.5]